MMDFKALMNTSKYEFLRKNECLGNRDYSGQSLELYDIMLKRGYPEEFCNQITKNLNTDWTAQRMIGYLSYYKKQPLEEIVDEMLAILSDRNRIMQKHELEETNAKWNEYLNR